MKKEEKNHCVYAHINKSNKKIYIGITKNPKSRWHPCMYKTCDYFYAAIKKYGWDNFEHIILIDNITRSMAGECEKELIKKYQTNNRKYGYNLAKGGTGGATVFGENHPLSKPVYQYSLDGNFIKKWDYIKLATMELGIANITRACLGECKMAGGFQWSFDKFNNIGPYSKKESFEQSESEIFQLDINFNVCNKYKNISAILKNGRNREKIMLCCKGKNIMHKGYFWMFANDYNKENICKLRERYIRAYVDIKKHCFNKVVIQYDIYKNKLNAFSSAKTASDKTGIKPGTIQHACKSSSTHYAKGFYWYYQEDELKPA